MYSAGVELTLGLVILIWLFILSYLIYKQRKFIKALLPESGTGDLKDKLDEVLRVIDQSKQRDQILNRNLRQVVRDGLAHIQKLAILRYNPYQDTGGDQSFSIAMLNGKDSGFLLTSLHTRAGTRIYAKTIDEGKSATKLSKEEQQVLDKALNNELTDETD